mmetsp:Transcript_19542/g.23251  ORF Transcript_19542/g.23251 Transcript_19542/m.23251 type:complete len:286 (-) Transcript_19542:1264-2121(-)
MISRQRRLNTRMDGCASSQWSRMAVAARVPYINSSRVAWCESILKKVKRIWTFNSASWGALSTQSSYIALGILEAAIIGAAVLSPKSWPVNMTTSKTTSNCAISGTKYLEMKLTRSYLRMKVDQSGTGSLLVRGKSYTVRLLSVPINSTIKSSSRSLCSCLSSRRMGSTKRLQSPFCSYLPFARASGVAFICSSYVHVLKLRITFINKGSFLASMRSTNSDKPWFFLGKWHMDSATRGCHDKFTAKPANSRPNLSPGKLMIICMMMGMASVKVKITLVRSSTDKW